MKFTKTATLMHRSIRNFSIPQAGGRENPKAFDHQLQTTSSPSFPLRGSRASETRARVKINPHEKGETQVPSLTSFYDPVSDNVDAVFYSQMEELKGQVIFCKRMACSIRTSKASMCAFSVIMPLFNKKCINITGRYKPKLLFYVRNIHYTLIID